MPWLNLGQTVSHSISYNLLYLPSSSPHSQIASVTLLGSSQLTLLLCRSTGPNTAHDIICSCAKAILLARTTPLYSMYSHAQIGVAVEGQAQVRQCAGLALSLVRNINAPSLAAWGSSHCCESEALAHLWPSQIFCPAKKSVHINRLLPLTHTHYKLHPHRLLMHVPVCTQKTQVCSHTSCRNTCQYVYEYTAMCADRYHNHTTHCRETVSVCKTTQTAQIPSHCASMYSTCKMLSQVHMAPSRHRSLMIVAG